MRLWWSAMGIAVLANALGLVLPQHTAVVNLFLPAPFTAQAYLTTGAIIRDLIFLVVDVVVWSLLVRATGRGSNTARWWLTVLAAIEEVVQLLSVVSGFYRPTIASVLQSLIGLVVFSIVLLAIIAMHKPGAQIYFERLT